MINLVSSQKPPGQNISVPSVIRKSSQYIRIKNVVHKQYEKPACASKQDVLELETLQYVDTDFDLMYCKKRMSKTFVRKIW